MNEKPLGCRGKSTSEALSIGGISTMDASAYRHIPEDAERVLRWAAVGIGLTLILSLIGLATVICFAMRVAALA
jgi:hypothetical protein